jgi:DNA ligase (NAD+)
MITLQSLDLEHMSPQDLGELMMEAKKAYYVDSKPIMDDHTWDILEDILRQKNPYHRIFTKVGNKNFNLGFQKKKHTMPMGSQNKVNNYKDLVHYFELKKISKDTEFVVQPKCDGISLEIEYKQGRVVDAITRGDGIIGDVITQNVVKMKNFVEKIDNTFTGSIRCEIVMLLSDFKKLNSAKKNISPLHQGEMLNEVKQRGLKPKDKISSYDLRSTIDDLYSNPRNAVSGISQRLDGQYSELCTLMAVDVFSQTHAFKTESEKMDFLKKEKIVTVDSFLCKDFSQIEKIYQQFLNKDRKKYSFEIDGLVIKINSTEIQKELGSKNNRPKGQVAYKFPFSTNQTQILEINWQVGPLGTITPVAKVEPIEVSGAIITFASLANYDLIKEKNININDIVEISRRGDVIPHIEKVISKVTPGHIHHPNNCPSCNTKLIIDNKFLRCPNSANCLAQILGGLKLFCNKLEIKGLSEKTIEKLYDAKKIKFPGDFYKLKVDDIKDLENLGEKSAKNIIDEIQSKKDLSLRQIFDSASIPNFSAARIQQLIDAGFDTPKKLLNITISQLEALSGIQITLAKKIFDGIQAKKEIINSIISQTKIENSETKKENLILKDLSFCITGELSIPRKEIEKIIENNGGKVSASVSKNTSYLITNETEPDSSKFLTAKKLGIKIINEKEFNNLINL